MFKTCHSLSVVRFQDGCHTLSDWPGQIDLASISGNQGGNPPLPEAARALWPGSADERVWLWISANHRYNCLLWNEEDLARRTQATDTDIALNKRRIDRFNQRRNDAMERIDDALLGLLAESVRPMAPDARVSSETAGAMIDRLSILSLKIHHMGLQTLRTDVDEAHRRNCAAKLAQLQQQRSDLAACLDRLLDESVAGSGFFRIYRQFKMYNDPELNPVLVAERQARA